MKKMRRSVVATLLLIIIMFGNIYSVFAINSSGTEKWVAGQYDTRIKTTDNKKNVGILARRLVNYTTKERITTFCGEHFINSPTGTIETGHHSIPSNPNVKRACKIAYFGWYEKYGDYVVDGGILANDMKWVKLDYVFTQQMIWEALGQSNAKFIESSIQTMYENFKNNINSKISNTELRPNFSNNPIVIDAGDTKTITDLNGVLSQYNNLDKTVDGIRLVHKKGENNIKIIVDKNCNVDNLKITDSDMESWGMIKDGTQNRDTTVYITFKEGVQNQLYSMHYNDPISMKLNLKIQRLGSLELSKLNENKDLIDGSKFRVISQNGYNNLVTVKNGKIKIDNLKVGWYKIQEENSPYGYLLNTETYNAEIKPNQVTEVAIENKEPLGKIIITKQDSETKNKPQGDATFNGAKYELRADEDIFNIANTKKFYTENELVATRTMNTEGITDVIENLPMGKYKVKEIISSEGYLIDTKEYKIELKYQGQNVKIVTQTVTSNEVVKKQNIHIFKSGIKEHSGEVNGLEGAEFSFKLEREVNQALNKGYSYDEIWEGITETGDKTNVNNKRVQEAQKIAPTYEKITTDNEGNAYTKKGLPYGKYLGKETKTPKDYETSNDFSFSITKDKSEIKEIENKIKHIFVNNTPLETYIKFIKEDKETGKIVTLNSTTFKIKAFEDIIDRGTGKVRYKKGDAITQKVGKIVYETFTTNADNKVIPKNSYSSRDDTKGEVVTPLKLTVGKYQVDEIITPNGFLRLENPVIFEISNIKNYDQDPHGDYIKEVTISNDKPIGEVIVDKTILYRENVDKTLLNKNFKDYKDIEFVLIAKENIIDVADGSIIYKKGQEVDRIKLNLEPKMIKQSIDNLPMGIYELYEVKTSDGLVLDNTRYEIKFIQKDDKIKLYREIKNITNDTTEVEFSKTDITGEKEVQNAYLQVMEADTKKVVDKWISKDKPHIIEGLTVGKEYIFREEIAPKGYVKATDVKFKVENTKEMQKVKMVDKVVEVRKTDVTTGKELEGANLKVIEKDTKKLIEEWTSTKEPHIVNGLEENKTYLLIETIAPYGYYITEEIEFTVTQDKETQKIVMKDKPILTDVKLIKIDEETNRTIKKDFTFGIYSDENCKDLIEKVKSNKKEGTILFEKLRYGIYYIQEIIEPEGYVITDKIIKLEINDQGVFIDNNKLNKVNSIFAFKFGNEKVITNIEVNKKGFIETQNKDKIYYNFKNIKNKSNVPLDNFTWQDTLPTQAVRIDKIYTGTWNEDLRYSVWYRTNKKDYKLFIDKLDTKINNEIDFKKLKLDKDEYIIEYQFRFGKVKVGFSEVESPILYCDMLNNLENGFVFTNYTKVFGNYKDKYVEDIDKWTTIVYHKKIEINNKLPRTGY